MGIRSSHERIRKYLNSLNKLKYKLEAKNRGRNYNWMYQ